jgi:hypothetical protein
LVQGFKFSVFIYVVHVSLFKEYVYYFQICGIVIH